MKKLPATMVVVVVTTLLLAAGPAGAIERTWTGATGNDWHTTANWDPSTDTVAESDDLIVLSGTPTASFNVISDDGGSITLDGPAAVADFSDFNLIIGNTGQGSMDILGEADMSSNTGCIGDESGSTGTVTVDGAGSTWTNSGSLYVGNDGTGTLNVTDGGAVSNTTGYIGYSSGSSGAVIVNGAGSTWTTLDGEGVMDGMLCIGLGTLDITNGGTVSSVTGHVNRGNGLRAASVSGTGSTWTTSSYMNIYNGTLDITDGGVVSTGTISGAECRISYFDGSAATVTVSGAGSAWTNNGKLIIGYEGTGTLAIANGGAVSTTGGYISLLDGSSGTVTVDGAGSIWSNNGHLDVAGCEYSCGTGTLTITNGGAVTVAGSLTLTELVDASGTVNIEDGSLTVGWLDRGAGTALFKYVGDSATVSVDGDFLYSGSGCGTVVFELDGLERTIIDVGSDVDLRGSTIEVGLADGYSIAEGTMFTLFEAGDMLTATDAVFDYDSWLWNVTVTEGVGGTLTAEFLGKPLPGDANDDGVVDDEDASILAAHWQQTGMNWADGDFSGDRMVNDKDASILAAHWHETTKDTLPVPEPGSFALILLATLTGLVGFAWRKTTGRL